MILFPRVVASLTGAALLGIGLWLTIAQFLHEREMADAISKIGSGGFSFETHYIGLDVLVLGSLLEVAALVRWPSFTARRSPPPPAR